MSAPDELVAALEIAWVPPRALHECIDAGDNRISSGPFQVGSDIYFAQSIAQCADDVIQ